MEREKWERNGRGGYLFRVENGEAKYFSHSSSPFGIVRTRFGSQAQKAKELKPKEPNTMNL